MGGAPTFPVCFASLTLCENVQQEVCRVVMLLTHKVCKQNKAEIFKGKIILVHTHYWIKHKVITRPLTEFVEVCQSLSGWSVVDLAAQREESEAVKQLEDGVSRLVNGHDHNPVP